MRIYLVIDASGEYPNGWRGLGLVKARSRKSAQKEAGARWPRYVLVVRSVWGVNAQNSFLWRLYTEAQEGRD
jgi:hypothetical protein